MSAKREFSRKTAAATPSVATQETGEEGMLKRLSVAAALLLLVVAPASAQQAPAPAGVPTRIRGTVDKLDDNTLTIKSREGLLVMVKLAPNVRIQSYARKSIADIKPGDFLASTGIRGTDGKIHAIEVRILPVAVPAGGRQFAWDLGPNSVMTNATVGTVTKAPEGEVVHVTFNGGESDYTIGPDVPILAPVPGDKSLLQPGAAVVVGATKQPDGSLSAGFIAAEKNGIKPPM
jgi:hypothetical protein